MTFRPRHALAAMALVLLAACGGGGKRVDPFEPRRLLVFGDEQSLLTPDGRSYSVNGVSTASGTAVIDCRANRIWIQDLADEFGLVLAACNPGGRSVSSTLYARPSAKVADVRAQIDQHFAGGSVNSRDLITIYAGIHDILELYTQFPALAESQLVAAAAQRGRQLADQANRLANADGRVLVLTIPNLGRTPFGLSERASRPDTDRAALLDRLTGAFNRELRLNLLNDGRLIGLVLADETIDALVQFPSGFQLSNSTQAACAVALPDCRSDTLVLNATAATWLWADSLRFGAPGHAQVGNAARSRARNNPF